MNYYVLYDTYGVGGYEFLYHCMKRLCCMCVCVSEDGWGCVCPSTEGGCGGPLRAP